MTESNYDRNDEIKTIRNAIADLSGYVRPYIEVNGIEYFIHESNSLGGITLYKNRELKTSKVNALFGLFQKIWKFIVTRSTMQRLLYIEKLLKNLQEQTDNRRYS